MSRKASQKKSNQIQIQQRLKNCEELLFSNFSRGEIVEFYREQGLSRATADNDIKACRDDWRQAFEQERGQRLYLHCQHLENLYKKAYSNYLDSPTGYQLRLCLDIRIKIAQLDGSYNYRTGESADDKINSLLEIIAELQARQDTVQLIG